MAEEGARSTGSSGRFGARYGRVARRRVSEIESDQNADHTCPECGAESVGREGTGVWSCDRCGYTFTGGAYRPETPGGRAMKRSIRAALGESGEDAEDVEAEVEDVEE